MNTTIDECRLIELPREYDPRGSLTYVYGEKHVPFRIRRTFFTYDVPGGEDRGAHAHREIEQFLVSAMGAFDVVLDDGRKTKTVRLERAFYGLYIPPMIWAKQARFSSGGICLVLTSAAYSEAEYIRDYKEFIDLKIGADHDRSLS